MGVFMRKVKALLDRVLNTALIVAVALLVFSVCWGVFTRFLLGSQAGWTEELARFLLIWIALLGGAVAFGARSHLGVDYFVGKLDPEANKLMAVVAHLVVLVFAVSIFLVGGFQVVRDSLLMEQTTPALGWKMGHVYLALPISGVFMVIYTLENILETLRSTPEQLREAASVETEALD